MPTYEYICRACGHEFEVFQSMTEAAKRKCPKCGKSALERKIGTGAAVLFKGSGFYHTDYRSESYKKAAESEKKPAEAAKSDSTKAEAAKTEGPKADSKPKAEPAAKHAQRKPKKASSGGD
jgi:putative FmdB family regulatory protein